MWYYFDQEGKITLDNDESVVPVRLLINTETYEIKIFAANRTTHEDMVRMKDKLNAENSDRIAQSAEL